GLNAPSVGRRKRLRRSCLDPLLQMWAHRLSDRPRCAAPEGTCVASPLTLASPGSSRGICAAPPLAEPRTPQALQIRRPATRTAGCSAGRVGRLVVQVFALI